VVVLLIGAAEARGAGAKLVRDLVPGSEGSKPSKLINVSGTLFFVAETRAHGSELWRSDGTRRGTRLVRDIIPGPVGSDPARGRDVAGTLFFVVDDGIHGRELWRSDGTKAGTTLVRDINPGSGHSWFHQQFGAWQAAPIGETLFFTANDGVHGHELWRSDGTEAGTTLVREIFPGPEPCALFGPHDLEAIAETLFFACDDGITGNELWRSDGTEAGTTLVRDINPGGRSSGPFQITEVDETLFFRAETRVHGAELWRSDGTEAGTMLVRDIFTGRRGSFMEELTEFGGALFVSAIDREHDRELWRSDGTEAGTTHVFTPGSGRAPSDLTDVGGTLFFADYGRGPGELMRSDGTEAGTRALGRFRNGIRGLTGVGRLLYFVGEQPLYNIELWRSNGTRTGTTLVRDINPGRRRGSGASYLTAVGNRLFFAARNPAHGRELWKAVP
jgi:ELWxxDGT repeat protein